MNKFLVIIAVLMYFFITSCSSDAGTGELPDIHLEPQNISFEDSDLFPNVKSEPKYLEIENTGEGDLKINKIFFNDSAEGDIDYYIDNISNIKYAEVVYPIILKKGDIAKVKIYLIPTDDGVKEATIQIDSNMQGDSSTKFVNVTAADFSPALQIDEVVMSFGNYNNKSRDITDLTIKKCPDNGDLNQGTLINVCNVGKAALKIESINLEGDALVLEYIDLEQLNTPAKIPGSFIPEEGTCITGLSICHRGNSGESAVLKISSTSEDSPTKLIGLLTE